MLLPILLDYILYILLLSIYAYRNALITGEKIMLQRLMKIARYPTEPELTRDGLLNVPNTFDHLTARPTSTSTTKQHT